MLRKSAALGLSFLVRLLLVEPSGGAKDSQILETLYRSKDELSHQIESLKRSQVLLTRALKDEVLDRAIWRLHQ